MTLALRLSVLVLAGVLIGFVTYRLLWPATSFAGTYALASKAGSYQLELSADRAAVLTFKDKKGRQFGYRGQLQKRKIVWLESRQKTGWVQLADPVEDPVSLDALPATLTTREGTFMRLQSN